MKKENNLPWLCCGDFNEILFNYEKEGGPPRVERCMEDFRKALEDCDLHDLGFTGDPFTWRNNHHVAASYKRERLDRAVANSTWRNNFSLVKVITTGRPSISDKIWWQNFVLSLILMLLVTKLIFTTIASVISGKLLYRHL